MTEYHLKQMFVGYILAENVSKMYLILSVTFLIFFAMCGVLCVRLANSNLDYQGDILITHLIITIRWKVSTFPIIVIFSRGCVLEVVVPSYAVSFMSHDFPLFTMMNITRITDTFCDRHIDFNAQRAYPASVHSCLYPMGCWDVFLSDGTAFKTRSQLSMALREWYHLAVDHIT